MSHGAVSQAREFNVMGPALYLCACVGALLLIIWVLTAVTRKVVLWLAVSRSIENGTR